MPRLSTLPSQAKFEINSVSVFVVGSWLAIVSPLQGKCHAVLFLV